MIRFLGFIVGSIASVAVLVMLVGIPSFQSADDATRDGRFDVVIQQLKEKQRTANEIAETASTEASALAAGPERQAATGAPPQTSDTQDSPTEEDGAEAGFEQRPATTVGSLAATADDGELAEPDPIDSPFPAEPVWQPFWNPFRSEIAANGFVSRLEDVTGLDYRVVKVKAGVYEVAFSYHDDDERSSKLSQIAAATGLDLSDAGR